MFLYLLDIFFLYSLPDSFLIGKTKYSISSNSSFSFGINFFSLGSRRIFKIASLKRQIDMFSFVGMGYLFPVSHSVTAAFQIALCRMFCTMIHTKTSDRNWPVLEYWLPLFPNVSLFPLSSVLPLCLHQSQLTDIHSIIWLHQNDKNP